MGWTVFLSSGVAGDSAVKSEFLMNGDSISDNSPDNNNHIMPKDYTSSTPGITGGLTRPLKPIEREEILVHLDRLKFFLATTPSRCGRRRCKCRFNPLIELDGRQC
jgi:hypothetical protein